MQGMADRCGNCGVRRKRLCALRIKAADDNVGKGIVMKRTQRYLIPALLAAPAVVGLIHRTTGHSRV